MVTIDRRRFLELGVTGAGAAIACGRAGPAPSLEAGELPTRPLGGTGLDVSTVAFGAHGVDNPPLMAAALEAGINTFCTSGRYLDGREEAALGDAIASIGVARDRVVVMTGNELRRDDTADTITADIDASLRRLRTEHIDIYYNAQLDVPAQVTDDALHEAIDRARQAGKVRHLGLSAHGGGLQHCLRAAIADGRYDVFFIKYDFVSYPELGGLLEQAAARGIGTLVFKTTAGNRQHEIRDLERGGLSFPQATLKWALTNPAVASVAVTLTSYDQIRECVAAAAAPLVRAEVEMLRRYADEMYHRYCRFCGECETSCPRATAVADINRYEMYFTCYGREKQAMRLYRELPDAANAAACRDCSGPCDSACPFGRPVRDGLIEAHRRLRLTRA